MDIEEITLYLPKRFGLVLSLLTALGNEPIEGRTRLVKMLLLLQEKLKDIYKHELDSSYTFIPHFFGPFPLDIFFDIELAKKMGLIEERKEKDGNLTLVLTENGKEKALSYNIEEMKIAVPKHWDEKWRIVIFDIPETLKGKREILRFRLKGLGFYELQKSVFVYPFNCYNEIEYIVEFYQIRKFVRFIVADFIDNELHLKEHFGLK